MATLYVENVPEDVYGALRDQAKRNRRSISAEVLSLLAANIVTPLEAARRAKLLARSRRIRSKSPLSSGPFPSAEEMLRQDRGR